MAGLTVVETTVCEGSKAVSEFGLASAVCVLQRAPPSTPTSPKALHPSLSVEDLEDVSGEKALPSARFEDCREEPTPREGDSSAQKAGLSHEAKEPPIDTRPATSDQTPLLETVSAKEEPKVAPVSPKSEASSAGERSSTSSRSGGELGLAKVSVKLHSVRLGCTLPNPTAQARPATCAGLSTGGKRRLSLNAKEICLGTSTASFAVCEVSVEALSLARSDAHNQPQSSDLGGSEENQGSEEAAAAEFLLCEGEGFFCVSSLNVLWKGPWVDWKTGDRSVSSLFVQVASPVAVASQRALADTEAFCSFVKTCLPLQASGAVGGRCKDSFEPSLQWKLDVQNATFLAPAHTPEQTVTLQLPALSVRRPCSADLQTFHLKARPVHRGELVVTAFSQAASSAFDILPLENLQRSATARGSELFPHSPDGFSVRLEDATVLVVNASRAALQQAWPSLQCCKNVSDLFSEAVVGETSGPLLFLPGKSSASILFIKDANRRDSRICVAATCEKLETRLDAFAVPAMLRYGFL